MLEVEANVKIPLRNFFTYRFKAVYSLRAKRSNAVFTFKAYIEKAQLQVTDYDISEHLLLIKFPAYHLKSLCCGLSWYGD